MLTEEERGRIREEEIFREEMRRKIAAETFFESRAWKILNASIVLWLLSSIVVTGLTQWYSRQQSAQAEQSKKLELERRLDTEIGNRVHQVVNALQLWKTGFARGSPGNVRATYAVIAVMLNNTVKDVDYSVFPEYRTRNFPSLLIELSAHAGPGEMGDLKKALAAYERIQILSSDLAGDRPNTPEQSLKMADDATALMRANFQKNRWALGLYPDG